jgi:hypothetical protein
MVQVRLNQLIESSEALSALASQPLAAIVSFRLSKLMKACDGEIREFGDARLKKAKELGTLSEDGSQYIFADGVREKFVEDLNALLGAEVALPGEQIKLADLDKAQVAPKHFAVLDWLISE